MTRTVTCRRWRGPLAVLLLAVLASGCGVLPTTGPVEHVARAGVGDAEATTRFVPPGPSHGDTQEEIASGFLTAMTGNPLGVPIARRFLSPASQDSWRPTQQIVVYDSADVVSQPAADRVGVQLGGVRRLDDRGGWLGGTDAPTRLTLRLALHRGEWRIAAPPDALIIPSWYFTEHYRPLSLYFFDQTNRVLVPNRVYVPRGDDAATALVRGLLGGPGAALAPVTRTAIPVGTGLDLSALVRRDGVADVPLSGPIGNLSADRLGRVLAQLTTTLRQVPAIRRVRLLTGDAALTLPNGRRSVSVEFGARWSPSVNGSSDALFGLRGRRVVDGRGDGSPVDGPFGAAGLAVRSVGVEVSGKAVAAVGDDGRSVLTAPSSGPTASASAVRRVYTGTDVLRPAYDMFDGLWLIDRRGAGARVLLRDADGLRTVTVPGVSGRRVTAFLISRDGARLVALIDGGTGPDRVVLSYLVRRDDGTLVRASPARAVSGVPTELGDLVDLSWFGPTALAGLPRPPAGSTVGTSPTHHGGRGGPDTIPPDTWRGDAQGLVGSYDPALPLYLATPGSRLLVLDRSTSRWRESDITPGLSAAAYAG